MKRKLILFLLAFLVTAGVGITIMLKLAQSSLEGGDAAAPDASGGAAAADGASASSSSPGAAGREGSGTGPKAGNKPGASEPGSGSAGDTVTTPRDAASADGEGSGQAAAASGKKLEIPAPAVKPRSREHAAALSLGEALRMPEWAEALDLLERNGLLDPEARKTLADWMSRNRYASQEEVGDLRRPDGSKVTRYRFRSEGGTEDALVDLVTTPDGKTRIERVQIVPTEAAASGATPAADADPLQISETFVGALRRGRMAEALHLVTGKDVSYATVAGICMIFEENHYKLRPTLPIRGTFENDTNAGYLVYLVTEQSPRPANIGLELEKTAAGWRVRNVALDALLSEYESSASAEGGRYFPIVKNPKGGDSLALFFAFNESTLTPRSMRQLEIVAELLKQSKGTLKISGHTDDVGSQSYNLGLSKRRADAVKAALVSFGVQASQINTEGLGKSQPRRLYKSGDSEQEIDYIRGENRRAEIYLDFE